MAMFEGTHEETVVLSVGLDAAKAHFADTAVIVGCTDGVVSSEVDGDVVHFVLEPQNHGISTFQPDYRCQYRLDGDVLRWETLEGNTWQSGEARFTPRGEGLTEVAYTETVKIEIGVPAMAVPMLKPLVAAMVKKEVAAYLQRVVAAL